MKQLIHNAIIFNRGTRFLGYLEIDTEGRIANVAKGAPQASILDSYEPTEIIDLKGDWLLPGAIDSHVHFRDPGLTHKATIASESKAAIAGGVTSFVDMPNTLPQTTTGRALADKFENAAANSLANYSFYIGATADNIEELRKADYSAIPGIKLFMGASTGGMCVREDSALDEIFSLGRLVAVHCEDEAVINHNKAVVAKLYPNDDAPIEWHPVIRSERACIQSTSKAIAKARQFDTRLHICHVSTASELEFFTSAAIEEKQITAEACVPHLLFASDDYSRLGTRIKCNPAVKGALNRDALRKALVDGRIDVISTDHAPHTLEEKSNPHTLSAPSGMPMVQFSLVSMLQLTRSGILTPERVVELMCHNQARLLGIEGRGYIEKGMWADLVRIKHLEEAHSISDSDVISKCGWTPLVGFPVNFAVGSTWVNGCLTFDNGHFTDAKNPQPLKFRNY